MNSDSIKTETEIKAVLRKTDKILNSAIKEVLDFYVDENHKKIIEYQIFTGGKRIRPCLAILSCQMMGGKLKDILYPAAGLEILHNYSLIIDDIIDHSELRRGKKTTWFKFGKSIAQCIGIDYSVSIFQAINKSRYSKKITELFAKTMKITVSGEILDLLFEQGERDDPYIKNNQYKKIDKKDYFEMVSKKTADIIQTCCEAGGICAGAKKRELKALKNFGFNLGFAGQIKDDILDIFGKQKIFGKEIGKDIKERKAGNIVILIALQKLNLNDKKKFLMIMKKKEISDKDVNRAINMIEKTGAREEALVLGKNFVFLAKENLKILPQNRYNNLLKIIADFMINREK